MCIITVPRAVSHFYITILAYCALIDCSIKHMDIADPSVASQRQPSFIKKQWGSVSPLTYPEMNAAKSILLYY